MRTHTRIKRTMAMAAVLCAACLNLSARPALAAEPSEEEARLIEVLQSQKGAAEKDAACQKLKRLATPRSAPALGGLLSDPALSMSARLVLETLPGEEASKALRDAAAKAGGLLRAGIVDSIGMRRDGQAVAMLVPLLSDAEGAVASSSAVALGRIGGGEALAALQAARAKAARAVRPAVEDGLLMAIEGLVAKDRPAAEKLYRDLADSDAPEHVRTAALRGWMLAGGDKTVARVLEGLAGKDAAAQVAAVQLVREVGGAEAVKAFADVLASGKLPAPVQAGVIWALAQRGDRAAAPAILACADAKTDPAVRLAAVRALASMGDATAVPALAQAAAEDDAALRDAARYSLAVLKALGAAQAIVDTLAKAPPALQVELVRAIGQRREPAAAAGLVQLARTGDPAVRNIAIQAAGQIGDDAVATDLTAMLAGQVESEQAEAIEKAVVAIAARSAGPGVLAQAALGRMEQAAPAVRARLLRLAGRIGGNVAHAALHDRLDDPEPAVRDAALRTLADYGPLGSADRLLALARQASEPAHRVLALRGYCRLIGAAGDRTAAQRLAMCRDALAAAARVEEKRLAVAQLAGIASADALTLAEQLAADKELKGEAELASARIASALASTDVAAARPVLKRLAESASDPAVRDEAAKTLGALDQYQGYITVWQFAGPYRQEGKACQALFDIAFDPEKPDAKVAWKPLPGTNWQADLLEAVGGHQAVIYVRAHVIAPKACKVRLDMGSDDGLKVWINGKLVHANNAMRAVAPMQDKASAELKEGANEFLVKVTQNNMGCAVCIRIRNEDGSVIPGLKFE